ncbi:MAG: preprotein translocase subunit SecY [Candidatus Aenigmarchaeota archaeon]|nr:preprotein translocase subunit SecY [Candidatus Aenigmarchaeota archaeon]
MEEEEKGPRYIKLVSRFLPVVVRPTFRQSFNQRIKWTILVLTIFLLLSHVTVYGLERTPEVAAGLEFYELVLGSRMGSLVTLGIGPIVTAGILLQLLVGSKIIAWDTTKVEDREKFMFWNKFLAISFCFIEAVGFVVGGIIRVASEMLGIVIIQIAIGGIIVILLDEIVSKWGFGSGVSLFIAAGVGTQIMLGFLSPFTLPAITPDNPGPFVGRVLNFFTNIFAGETMLALLSFLPIFFTIGIFLFVAYTDSVCIDVPLTFARLRGFGRIWSLKLLYTSVIPIILASALVANLQLIARSGATPQPGGISCGFLGCYDETGRIIWVEGKSNIVYYLSAPVAFVQQAVRGMLAPTELVRAITYTLFLTTLATIFSVFWVITSGMSAESVAEQLSGSGMQIPGFRADKAAMKAYLDRYIPALAVLGGISIGLLASFGDLTGAIGGGTGILLLVVIIHSLYEQLKREKLEEAHPLIRKLVSV